MTRVVVVAACKRVVVVAACVVAGLGCDEGAATTPAPSGRVVAVSGKASGPDLAGFCDQYSAGETASALTLPPLDGAAPTGAGRPRWVNVWATWCKPCVEEMPRLLAWQKRLAEQGKPLDLVFVSVDVTPDAIAQFRSEHPEMPESLHVSNTEAFSAWLPTAGLADGSPIPMHLYADARGYQRCARAGAVAETDFSFVQTLIERHP